MLSLDHSLTGCSLAQRGVGFPAQWHLIVLCAHATVLVMNHTKHTMLDTALKQHMRCVLYLQHMKLTEH